MEVNKDEAVRCLDIAKRHLNSGNFASARKFGGKSISLFPTDEAKAFLTKVDQQEAKEQSTPSSTKSSPNPNTTTSSASSSTNATSSSQPAATPQRPKSTPVEHKPVDRDYTTEQVAAVRAVRSSGGDFYKVLGIKKDANESEIKKAYRKLALQMHPDKNGAPGADEAFKIVSKAFTVLSDPQKRAIFDQHGPDEGKSSSVNYDRAQPTGFGGAGMNMNGFGEEISPEELFNMFFGGNSFGGSFHSATFAGPGFGSRQYRRNPMAQRQQQQQQQRQQGGNASGISSMIQIMPLILLFIISMVSNLFSDSGSSSKASIFEDFSLTARQSYTTARFTEARNIPYFVNIQRFNHNFYPQQTGAGAGAGSSPSAKRTPELAKMESYVEQSFLQLKREECTQEKARQQRMRSQAMGLFGIADKKKWNEAQNMKLVACEVVEQKFGFRYR